MKCFVIRTKKEVLPGLSGVMLRRTYTVLAMHYEDGRTEFLIGSPGRGAMEWRGAEKSEPTKEVPADLRWINLEDLNDEFEYVGVAE